jgi:hypothetical protein
MDCLDLSQRSPDNPWDSVFHHMRGFFISSAASPGQGPQLGTANAGDVLTLQARVYNYSLAAMAPDTQVHVRFYFTPWDTDKKLPAGDSVLINEVVRGPIPPFNDADGAPLNWVLVPTTFDTGKFDQTKNGNVSVVFWVLVWMQGKMVSEMPGHGLKGVPETLNSFADAAKLEECQSDGKCYSNNLGLYKQEFCILPPAGAAAPQPLAALAGTASVNISKVEIPAQQINRSENAIISATLSARARSLASVSAEFYDGDPQHGGRLFDVEQVPCLQNDTYRVETLYRTNTCGVHDLFVVVNAGQHRVVRRAPPVNVACSTSH